MGVTSLLQIIKYLYQLRNNMDYLHKSNNQLCNSSHDLSFYDIWLIKELIPNIFTEVSN